MAKATSPAPLTARAAQRALRQLATAERAQGAARFFKTGKGEYGEGDVFIGVTVPDTRRVAKEFRALPLTELDGLIRSPVHEERLTGLLILVSQFERAKDEATREKLFRHYCRRLDFVNNWDLVDATAPKIVGAWLADKPRTLLYELARSKDLWRRRVAVLATFHFIQSGEETDALRIAELLLKDEHDLIHKALGWMLREVGKRVSPKALERFLQRHAATMPRTMLRYAIERLPPSERDKWMKKKRKTL